LLGLLAGPVRAEEIAHDARTLRDAGIGSDGPALLAYLKAQTPTETDRARLAAAAQRLGHRSFTVREKALRTLTGAGRPALPYLKAALANRDLEVVRRAERGIQEIERVPYVSVMTCLARMLAVRRPAGTVEALLAYMPSASEESVEEALLKALAATTTVKDKIHPTVRAALKDREPARRAAAAYVFGRATPPETAPLLPLLKDTDPSVRLQAATSLVLGRDKAGVPVLIALLAEAPPQLGWRVEDLLFRLAGEAAPRVALGAGDETARGRCREAWLAWWKTNGTRTDLAKINLADPVLGVTLYCEYDTNNAGGEGRVWLAGQDGKLRWEVRGLAGPNDARLLPGGRILIAERNANRVTERDQKGTVLWERRVDGGAIAADRLPGGNTLITSWNAVLEVTPGGRTVWTYTHPSGFRYAYRLRNGHILGISANGQVVELDAAGRVLKTVTPAQHAGGAGYWGSVEQLPNGRMLLALGTSRKVVEIDTAGKIHWEADVPNAVFATRLRNGHTLVCNFEQRVVVELDRGGKEVTRQALSGRPFAVRRY
jgi:hypothetical protein